MQCFILSSIIKKYHLFLKMTGGRAESLGGWAQPNHALPWLRHYRQQQYLLKNQPAQLLNNYVSMSTILSMIIIKRIFLISLFYFLFILMVNINIFLVTFFCLRFIYKVKIRISLFIIQYTHE